MRILTSHWGEKWKQHQSFHSYLIIREAMTGRSHEQIFQIHRKLFPIPQMCEQLDLWQTGSFFPCLQHLNQVQPRVVCAASLLEIQNEIFFLRSSQVLQAVPRRWIGICDGLGLGPVLLSTCITWIVIFKDVGRVGCDIALILRILETGRNFRKARI